MPCSAESCALRRPSTVVVDHSGNDSRATGFAEQKVSEVDLSGLLADVASEVDPLAHAMVASEDGFPAATSAAASVSDAAGVVEQCEAGAVQAVTVGMQHGQLTLMPAHGGILALHAQSRCDVARLINQTEPALAALDFTAPTVSESLRQKDGRGA